MFVARTRWRAALWVTLAILAWHAPIATGVQQTPIPPAYRAGVVLVPVDVRVIRADGKPVTDLTAADFTVFENGVRQQIAHFSTLGYFEGAPPAPTPRTFFFLLGRGRLNETTRALDALIEFVHSRLLPEDRVGVLAYLHLVEPTTDHAAVVRLLERYRAQNEGIEDKLTRDGKRGAEAPTWELAPDTQSEMTSLFNAPGLAPVQLFPAGAGGTGIQFNDRFSFIRSLEYLGHVEGEKQLVLLIEHGFPNAAWYASGAAAARVSVSTIQTGGTRTVWPPSGRYVGSLDPAPSPGAVLSAVAARTLAELTGGQSSADQNASIAFDRLAHATSFQYVLGYYPIKPPADREYRELRVTVNRRGVILLYRHAYEARPRIEGPLELCAVRYPLFSASEDSWGRTT
jgi:VWFA-related protein